jgi:hypothetical protein
MFVDYISPVKVKEIKVKKIIIAGCQLLVLEVKPLLNKVLSVKVLVLSTRVFTVTYFIDALTGEILFTEPFTLHREMKAIHAAWREMGFMDKRMVPLNWYQRLMGFNPHSSYRRFFLVPIWEEVQN